MLFLGILWGAFNGRMAQVTEGALNAAGEAVTLSITMLGIVVFWNGILEIGSRAGLDEYYLVTEDFMELYSITDHDDLLYIDVRKNEMRIDNN